MKQSIMSVIFAAALLLQCWSSSAAIPMGKTEDLLSEQEAFTALLGDEAAENLLREVDLEAAGKPRGPRVIVVADPGTWRDLPRVNGLAFHKRNDEHREGQDANIPILRRDAMRCMVGRVYRPCWEV